MLLDMLHVIGYVSSGQLDKLLLDDLSHVAILFCIIFLSINEMGRLRYFCITKMGRLRYLQVKESEAGTGDKNKGCYS